ncbi:MAG: VCBS repeat-containing protein, partial [Planctomycetota bacterium]|nr:VCBS repeat-containing protein [Planctomycetota bacterium]
MKSRWTFTILLVALAALGVFLRPRTVYELWEARELPFGEDVWPRSSRGALVVLDLDGDGLDDVLWSFPEMVGSFSRLPAVAAFRNLGDRRFEPIPVPGIRLVDGPCRAAAAGDFDGDGSPDLLLSVADGKRLFLREGGRFRDVSAETLNVSAVVAR